MNTSKKKRILFMSQNSFRRFIGFGIALVLMLTSFAACGKEDVRSEDIVVLYTNDVHCGIEENIGYAGLAAYKKSTEQTYKYVTLVGRRRQIHKIHG